MNKIKNWKIKFLSVGVFLLLIIMFFLTPNKKEEVQYNSSKEKPTVINLLKDNQQPQFITWSINSFDLPSNIKMYKISSPNLPNNFDGIIKKFGFTGSAFVDDKDLVLFKDINSNFYWDKKGNRLSYSKDLSLSPLTMPTEIKNQNQIKLIFSKLIKEDFGIKNIDVKIISLEYQEIVGSRFFKSDEKNSNIVEIKATYELNRYPIYSPTGTPITVRFSRDGIIIKSDITLPSNYIEDDKDYSLKGFDEIKSLSADNFKILEINGDRSFNLSSFDTNRVKEVNIKKVSMGYVDISNYPYLMPYYIFEGDSLVNSGLVNVILVLPAIK